MSAHIKTFAIAGALAAAFAATATTAAADAAKLEALMQRSHDAKAQWLAGELDSFRDQPS